MRHFFLILLLLCSSPVAFADDVPVATPEVAEAEAPAAAPEATPKTESAEAEEVPASYDDAADSVGFLVKAVQDKNWTLALGLMLTLMVFLANKIGLKDRIGSKAVPWVATALAMSATSGIALVAGISVSEALVQGFLAGVVAIGGWEMLFKHILKAKASS
jgi:hypothetical protein